MIYDTVVAGGGPAGLAAATWLARYRRQTLLVDSGEYSNRWVRRTHGYLSRDGCDPAELRETARAQLDAYPFATVRMGRVTSARRVEGQFALDVDGEEVVALRLVLASGVEDVFPTVEGFFDFYGSTVFHCPACDGYEAAGKHVVALGWTEHVAGFALTLRDWASAVTLVTDGRRFPGDDDVRSALGANDVRIIEDSAVRFVGEEGVLSGVELAGGECLPCEMAFFSVDHRPRTALATMLGVELNEQGCIVVDEQNETSVQGVYACGDVTPGIQLVQIAASDGAVAGISCALSLRGHLGAPGSPVPGPDVDVVLDDQQ